MLEVASTEIDPTQVSDRLASLKDELGTMLKSPEQVKAPQGVATGLPALDQYLIWKGLPKAEISLLTGEPGFGLTTTLSHAVCNLTLKDQWAAWVDHPDYQLCPWPLFQQKANLQKLLMVSAADSEKKLIWMLSELCSLSLFELIVCDVTHYTLKRHHLIKIRQLAKRYQVAIVFKDKNPQPFLQSFYALAARFNSRFLEIQRAQHRPTPMRIERRSIYENFMPQLTEARKAFRRRELPGFQPKSSLS